MPKRLSDITHLYERTAADLETAQDELTVATEHYRAKVEAAGKAHREVIAELAIYLAAHPDEVVIANDTGYHWDRGQIVRRPVFWAHHVWVENPEPAPTYRVPRDNGEAAMVAAWNMGSEDPADEAAS